MYKNTDFWDSRLSKTGNDFFDGLIKKQNVCLRGLGETRAKEVQFGRFLRNEKVKVHALIQAETRRVAKLASSRHVLALQDTSEINYQKHVGKVSGLGIVGNGIDVGFFLHPALIVDAEGHEGLGLGAIHLWKRNKKARKDYQAQPIEEKESCRWLEVADQVKRNLHQAAQITLIADRESDIYEYWTRIPDEKTHIISRACRDRSLSLGVTLYRYADTLPGQFTRTVKVGDGRKSPVREAKLLMSFGAITIHKPKRCTDKAAPATLNLHLVYAREVDPPEGVSPICWRLLTTHAVNTNKDAAQIIDWYRQRWHIEQLFRTLKRQGLDIESSQVETAACLEKLVVMSVCAAFRVMELVLSRDGSHRNVTDVFNPEEIEVMQALQPTLEGKTAKQKNPHSSKSLAWASWIIARLGGWKGYLSERPPGPVTMKNGLDRFNALYQGWILCKDVCMP
jgi:hypothetical protein